MRIALLLAALLAAGGFKARGFSLPDGAVKVDDDRYRLPRYRSVYPPAKFPRSTLRNQSGIRAIHIENRTAGSEWEGANLYENVKGEVRVFVLAREETKPQRGK
jgi:hypothetical protein